MRIISIQKISIIILLVLFTGVHGIMAQCTLTAKCTGGNWSSAGTWTPSAACGTITTPGNNMMIVIPACASVTVNINSPTYSNMAVYIFGDLHFDVGQKINLSSSGYVSVAAGASLTGGNGGSKININGSSVWVGPGPDVGPFSFGNNPLPIEISSFSAKRLSENVELKWTTAIEINNDYFTIQRSIDASNWEEVEQVDGSGNSHTPVNYSYVDIKPYNDISYYRLKQTDFNGQSTLSNLVSVNSKNIEVLSFYPNPISELSNLVINSPEEMQVTWSVTSPAGKTIATREEKLIKGSNIINLCLSHLASGNYIFNICNSNDILSKKMIIIK